MNKLLYFPTVTHSNRTHLELELEQGKKAATWAEMQPALDEEDALGGFDPSADPDIIF